MKRYTVIIDLFMYADTDEQIKNEAANFTNNLNDKLDCRASVVEIHETPFGKLETRKID